MIGIYKFTNKKNGKVYIGQSTNIERRKQSHYWPSHSNKTPFDKILQTYPDLFTFEVIEECLVEDLDEREKYWIKEYDSYYNGYNCTLGGNSARGEICKNATFTNEEVLEIIKLLEEGNLSNTEIANLFNSTRERIRSINEVKCWNHLHNYKFNIRNENLIKKGVILHGQGEQSSSSKLTEIQVKEIIQLLKNSAIPMSHIAKQYNVSENAIKSINYCKTWTYLHNHKKDIRKESGHETKSECKSLLTTQQVLEVIKLLESTSLTHQEIGDKFNVSSLIITNINCCNTWTQLHTYKENIRKESGIGNRSASRISESTVLKIISLLESSNLTHQEIAKQCQVHKSTVANINQCKSHTEFHNYKKNIRQESGHKYHPHSNISESIAKKIIKLLENTTLTHKTIAEKYNILPNVVSSINQCKTWTYLHNYKHNIRQEAKLEKK